MESLIFSQIFICYELRESRLSSFHFPESTYQNWKLYRLYLEKLKPKPRYLFMQKFYKNTTNAYLQKKIKNMKLTTLLNNHNINNNWDLNWVNTELSVIRNPLNFSKIKKKYLDRNRKSWLVKLVVVNRWKLEKKLKISHPRDKMGKSVFYDTLGLEQ